MAVNTTPFRFRINCNTPSRFRINCCADNNPVRFGILGCADIARKVSRAIVLAPNADLYAIASRSLANAEKFAADNNFPSSTKAYGDYSSLLDDPNVDVAYIPLPTSLHARWAVEAANKGKHVLLEKPVAVDVEEFDGIAKACEENGVQLMDGTMWVHHPRTLKMKEFVSDPVRFGELKLVQNCFTFSGDPYFLNNNIRVKPDLDRLGALGDAGWYCVCFALWAANYSLPKTVIALPNPVYNDSGVLLECGASLHWEDGKVASFHCSFLANLTNNATAIGTKGSLHLSDFIIPVEEKKAAFLAGTKSAFDGMLTSWTSVLSENLVVNDLPQESCLVRNFADLVKGIKENGNAPEKKWPMYSRKTQLVLDAIKASIDGGFVSVEVVS